MAAPTATPRGAPDGFMLENGYQSLITIASDTTIELYEIEVGVPGWDGGEPVDTTTMHNIFYRTMRPRSLITLTSFTVLCGYDPVAHTALRDLVNIEDTFTVEWPSDQTLAFYGFIQLADFSPLIEGELPTVTLTIVPTNFDPVNCTEEAPVLTGTGTC